MNCLLLIDDAAPRRWHARLAAAAAVRGIPVGVRRVTVADSAGPPPSLAWLLLLDRTLHGSGPHALDAVDGGGAPRGKGEDEDVATVVDLTGRPTGELVALGPAEAARRHLVPLYDGVPGELALWSALLEGRAPRLDLLDAASGTVVPIGLPAIEMPHQLHASADFVIARLIEGIVRSVGRARAPPVAEPWQPRTAARVTTAHTLQSFAQIVAGKAQRLLQRRLRTGPQWAVAWRAAPNPPSLPACDLDLGTWNILPDDARRYYADPFVFAHDDRRYVFVEEYPYASGRGVISMLEIDSGGRVQAAPRPVLEAPFHLSYPQIIEDNGAIHMLPEAAASGRLTLYRAERFPDRWEPVADLLAERVHDATLLRHGGHYWLFATAEGEGGSAWDALNLYSASSLMGPWHAHAANPVLVDAASARPAGQIAVIDGELWRPAQDYRRGYGAALTLARIDRLDRDGFAQSGLISWRAPAATGVLGPHTWNTGTGLEVVDLFAPRTMLTRT